MKYTNTTHGLSLIVMQLIKKWSFKIFGKCLCVKTKGTGRHDSAATGKNI